jgi:RNA polymerase sigma-70 factor (ECF subfamily)
LEELEDILQGCRHQDRRSQEQLYRRLYPALFALCKSFFKDQHVALTALNNGMLTVYRNLEQYDVSKGKFFNWAYTIVRHAALTMTRGRKAEPVEELEETTENIGPGNPFKQLEWKDIYVYLDALPDNTRVVCNLYYLQGYSLKEIAAGIGMKEGTVKWHLNETRHRLKNMITQQANFNDV